jgi:hypothetical protein
MSLTSPQPSSPEHLCSTVLVLSQVEQPPPQSTYTVLYLYCPKWSSLLPRAPILYCTCTVPSGAASSPSTYTVPYCTCTVPSGTAPSPEHLYCTVLVLSQVEGPATRGQSLKEKRSASSYKLNYQSAGWGGGGGLTAVLVLYLLLCEVGLYRI